MINRIDAFFAAQTRTALVTFITACDPDFARSEALLLSLPEAGADIVELGMPFSDPMADGPVIEAAGHRALKAGATMEKTLALVHAFRVRHPAVPLVLMGYINPVLQYGPDRLAADAAAAGVDGFIIVDLPPEEDVLFKPHCEAHNLHLIRLVTPTSDAARLAVLANGAGGFLYYVAVAGITGAAGASAQSVKNQVESIRQHSDLPICAGFGIKTPEDVSALAPYVQGVVVGSSIVQRVEAHQQSDSKTMCLDVSTFVTSLAGAAHAVPSPARA